MSGRVAASVWHYAAGALCEGRTSASSSRVGSCRPCMQVRSRAYRIAGPGSNTKCLKPGGDVHDFLWHPRQNCFHRMNAGAGTRTLVVLPAASTFPGRAIRTALTSLLIACTLGVAVYVANNRKAKSVPPAVADWCRQAAQFISDGAPLNAAACFEKAENYLLATGGEPIVMLEVLFQLGDCQLDAEQLKKAYETFSKAHRLATTLERTISPAAAAANAIKRKRVMALDRMATAADRLKDVAGADRLYASAIEYILSQFSEEVETALRYNASAGGALKQPARLLLADLAGIWFNRVHMHLTQIERAYAGASSATETTAAAPSLALLQALHIDASFAALLIAASQTAALLDAYDMLVSASQPEGVYQAAKRAADMRCACHRLAPITHPTPSSSGSGSGSGDSSGSGSGSGVRMSDSEVQERARGLMSCCATQRAEQPADAIAVSVGKLRADASQRLASEIRNLWELETATTHMCTETLRLLEEHAEEQATVPAGSAAATQVTDLK